MTSEEERRWERYQHLLRRAEELGTLGTFELDLRSGRITWSDEMYRLHGYEPGEVEPTFELIVAKVHPEDRDEFAAASDRMLDSPYQARRQYRIQLDDGTVRHLIGENQIEEDEEGTPVRLFGTVQDVTDETLVEGELLAHHELAQTLSEWDHLEEGLVDLMRRLATAMGCDAGSIWVLERGDVLGCRAFWAADPGRDEAIMANRPPRGQGIGWVAWERQEPLIVEDFATDRRVERKEMMTDAGYRSGAAIPVLHQGATLAVVFFHCEEARHYTERWMRTLTALGLELGRFFSRRRNELGLQELSPRELEVLKLASEGHSAPRIGEQLGISPATVKTHFVHVYEKLGVSDRAAAVAEAMRRGMFG